MKRTVFFIVILALLWGAVPIQGSQAPPTPQETVANLLEGIKNLDGASAYPYLEALVEEESLLAVWDLAVSPMQGYLDYRMGNAKITGNTAVVDVAVTAPDVSSQAAGLILEAIGCAALQKATDIPLDVKGYLALRIQSMLQSGEIYSVRTNTSVYLILGGDGRWKLDLSNSGNLHFLSALTGGLLDFPELMEALSGL